MPLANDMLRRQYPWQALLAIPLSAFPWWMAAAGGGVWLAFAISLGMTLAIGPLATVTSLPRAYVYLPVSRRDVRRATWLVAAVVAPALVAAVKLPALLFSLAARDGVSAAIALSTACDFGAASAGCMLLGRSGVTRPIMRSRRPLAPYRRGRLAGLPALILREARWTAGMAAGLAMAFAAIAYFVQGFGGEFQTMREFFRAQQLLIFDDVSMRMEYADRRAFGMAAWYAFFAASVSARFPELVRHLRTLPISTANVTALIVGWPAVPWLMVWATLLILALTIGDGVRALHTALWIQVVGLSALGQALTFWSGDRFKLLFYTAPIWLVPLLQMMSRTHPFVGATLAAAAIVVATLLIRRALLQSSTYANRLSPKRT